MSTVSGHVIDEVNRFMMEISYELGDITGKGAILNELRTHLFDQAEDIAKGEVDIDTAVFISMDLMGTPKSIAQRFKELEEEEPLGFVALSQESFVLLVILGAVCISLMALFLAFNPSIGPYFLAIGGVAFAGYVIMVIFLYVRTNQNVDEEFRNIGNTIAHNLNVIAQDIAQFGKDLMGHIEKATPREERQVIMQKQYKIRPHPPKQVVAEKTKPKKSAWGEHLGGIFGAIFGSIFTVVLAWLIWIGFPLFVPAKMNLFVFGALFAPLIIGVCVDIVKGLIGHVRTSQGLETLRNGVSAVCLAYLLVIFPFDAQAALDWFLALLATYSANIPSTLGFFTQANFYFALVLTIALVITLLITIVGTIKFLTFKKEDIRSLWASNA
ncbi:MAG: hypothetical protein ACFFCZ_19505 [Promethearchaeota archaeon]